jgi:hypothetical protein
MFTLLSRFQFEPGAPFSSIIARKNIFEPDFQPGQDRFQLIQREVMLPDLKPVQGRVRQSHPLRECGIGEIASRISQEARQLAV